MSTSRPALQLKYFTDTTPALNSVTKIADGIYWFRQSLPITGLDHINIYLIEDGEEWVVVDTGLGLDYAQEAWENVFKDLMAGRPISRVIVTHLHPDHVGNAGWLCRRFSAMLHMTREEYFLCRLMVDDTGKSAPSAGVDFYTKCGFNDEQLEFYKARFGNFGKAVTALPVGYVRLQNHEVLTIGDRNWRVVIGSGHSPEHACLWCEEDEIFLSGDQILPTISSNVSVWPTEPEGNPLGDWISSCKRLAELIGDADLVCPAHGIPFQGGPARLKDLVRKHENALERMLKLLQTPHLATEAYKVLFRAKIDDGNRFLAVGESMANLNLLLHRGQITRALNDKGQYLYQTI